MEITNHKTETRAKTESNARDGRTDLVNGAPGQGDIVDQESERLREELEIERDARLRLAAEYQNYRRRTEQEKARAADKGKGELLTELLTVVDDIDLALDRSNESPKTVVEGLGMIHRRFLDILEANGVTRFESEGEKFDPERHEAFDVVPSEVSGSGIVHRELRRGYFLKDRLLRPALVVVTQ